MTLLKIIGVLMCATPFIIIYVFSGIEHGFKEVTVGFIVTILMVLWIGLGVILACR